MQALYTEGVKSLADLEAAIDAIDHTSVREAVSRHVYDRDVAAAGVGKFFLSIFSFHSDVRIDESMSLVTRR